MGGIMEIEQAFAASIDAAWKTAGHFSAPSSPVAATLRAMHAVWRLRLA